MRQMTAEGQSDKMMSDMEVRKKQRCVIEFLHAEKKIITSSVYDCTVEDVEYICNSNSTT